MQKIWIKRMKRQGMQERLISNRDQNENCLGQYPKKLSQKKRNKYEWKETVFKKVCNRDLVLIEIEMKIV